MNQTTIYTLTQLTVAGSRPTPWDEGLQSVVHNLNSMLATMSTALRLLRHVSDKDTRGQLLDVIDDAAERAEQTVAKIRTRPMNC